MKIFEKIFDRKNESVYVYSNGKKIILLFYTYNNRIYYKILEYNEKLLDELINKKNLIGWFQDTDCICGTINNGFEKIVNLF
jgi:hypothetical protein